MSTPILTTKLYIPQTQPQRVLRPHLIEQLNSGLQSGRKLTIIFAPAGFGKTTLVTEWVGCSKRPFAWVSLDEGDSDPTRFFVYLITSLQTIAPTIGAGVLSVLQSPQPPPTKSLLIALLNEIATIPENFILVLDDYHVIDAASIDEALSFMLEHLPPQMHLVMTTREDPNLPLAKLRARGQLTELRAADLRFTPSEAGEFLNKAMGLDLSGEDISALDARTEGWIAGLQLAALSMRGHQDIPGFIQAFTGDHRYIVDYLVEEVLRGQPEAVRNFLLRTAILKRLNGPLCDAVTGQTGGQARLETLQRGNFFLTPLDDNRHWYRYHHLFADVLQMHLLSEQPDQIPVLHQRASAWYEQSGSPSEAIRHALAGGDFERAADLIELTSPAMSRNRQEAALLGWYKALPPDLIRCRPVLSVDFAHLLLDSGEANDVEDLLQNAERWLDPLEEKDARPVAKSADFPPDQCRKMVVVDEEGFRRLPGAIAVARSAQALAQGDVAGSIHYARHMLDLVPEDDHLSRGGATAFLGLASWANGDLEAAYEAFAEGMAHLQKAGNIADVIGGAVTLADILITQGRLREAVRTYERGLKLAAAQGIPVLRGAADMHVGLCDIFRERNDLHGAAQHLQRSQELGEFAGLAKNPYRRRVAAARIRQTQGDLDGALGLLHEAAPLFRSDFSPNVRPVAALMARVWIAQGRMGEALDWAREQNLSVEDNLTYLREYEHITLARILLARCSSDHRESALRGTIDFLERLRKAAEQGGRNGSVIEILVLQALAHHAQGDRSAALLPLQQALTLAEPEDYARIFLDEGASMQQLLREAAGQRIMSDYTGKLLAAFQAEGPRLAVEPSPLTSPVSQPLIEPLSQRELEVLRLLKTDLSGPEIANELMIALSTVRTYTKGIYSKLNVNNRRAAVKRAAELGLL